MAVGDIISDVINVAGSSQVNFQPAAGVEIILTAFASGVRGTILFGLFDSVLVGEFLELTDVANLVQSFKVGITNTLFLRLNNVIVTAVHMAYTGIQTQ